MKIISKLQLLVLASLPFSFIPSYIAADRIGNLNIEIGVQQVVLVVFALVLFGFGLREILAGRISLRALARQIWDILALRLLTIVMFWVSIGALYSSNASRALLVLAYAWLIWLVMLIFAQADSAMRTRLLKLYVFGAIISSIFAIWQFIAAGYEWPQWLHGIQDAYDNDTFGFPRPHALFLEPQYFASFLLAPIILLTWRIRTAASSVLRSRSGVLLIAALTCCLIAFWLTLSRGAFLALGTVGVAVGLYELLHPRGVRRVALLVLVSAASFAVSLALVFYISNHNIGGNRLDQGLQRYIEQASVGLIDFEVAPSTVPESSIESNSSATSTVNTAETGPQVVDSVARLQNDTDGVIDESTTGRIEVVQDALSLSASSLTTLVFGVGLADFGPSIAADQPDEYLPDQVVNNQYILLLVEHGLVGILLFATAAFVALHQAWRARSSESFAITMLVIVTAHAIQSVFYSTQTNVLHVWVLLGLLLSVSISRAANNRARKVAK